MVPMFGPLDEGGVCTPRVMLGPLLVRATPWCMKGAVMPGTPIGAIGGAPFIADGMLSPGGGPLAVEKEPDELVLGEVTPIELIELSAGGRLLLPGCPARTPNGFLEKLKRMPPLTLL